MMTVGSTTVELWATFNAIPSRASADPEGISAIRSVKLILQAVRGQIYS